MPDVPRGLNVTVPVPRPDRAGKVAMTTLGPANLRDSYKVLAVDCHATMGELQLAALDLMLLSRFEGVARSECWRVWEEIRKELERGKESEAGD
jgi:hypothetical protein